MGPDGGFYTVSIIHEGGTPGAMVLSNAGRVSRDERGWVIEDFAGNVLETRAIDRDDAVRTAVAIWAATTPAMTVADAVALEIDEFAETN